MSLTPGWPLPQIVWQSAPATSATTREVPMSRPLTLTGAFALVLSLTLTASAQKKDEEPKKDDAPKPPAGWKEHSPRDGTFVVWVPEKAKSTVERERTSTVGGQKLKFNVLAVEVPG